MSIVRNMLSLFNGGETRWRGTPFGAGLYATEIGHMIARGMGRHVSVGAFSTGIVGGGNGTILDLDQPELAIGVPAGYCIRPLRFVINVQPALAATDSDENEALIAVDSQGLVNALSGETATVENPSNMRTDLSPGSCCRVYSAYTADCEATPAFGASRDFVLDMELDRLTDHVDIQGTAATIWHAQMRLVYEPVNPPFLVGPCTLVNYFGGTAATIGGFIQGSWVEGRVEDFFHK